MWFLALLWWKRQSHCRGLGCFRWIALLLCEIIVCKLIESDSAILVKVLNEGSAMPPWKVARWIAEIRNLLFIMKPSIAHVVREANQPANKLANYGVLTMENGFDSSWAELPTEARGPNGQATNALFSFSYVVFSFLWLLDGCNISLMQKKCSRCSAFSQLLMDDYWFIFKVSPFFEGFLKSQPNRTLVLCSSCTTECRSPLS